MSLPLLNYLELIYPESYKFFVVAKKCVQILPFLANQELIDRVWVLEKWEGLGQNDIALANFCDYAVNPFPQHPPCPGLNVGIDNFWYNYYSCVEETIRMAGVDLTEFYKLPEQNRKPHLTQWFDLERQNGTICIHAKAGYNNEQKRNPTTQFWAKLVEKLNKLGYKVYHCGVDSEDSIEGTIRVTHLSLFEQIKLALSTECLIGNDSGFSWIYGCYGHNMVSLLTNHAPKITNVLNFAPLNYKNNSINLISLDGFDNLKHEDVLNAINELK